MIQRGLAVIAALLIFAQGNPVAFGQAKHTAKAAAQPTQNGPSMTAPAAQSATPAAGAGNAQQAAAGDQTTPNMPASTTANPFNSPARTDCFGANCDYQPPHISIATPAPAPAPWPWQERILWGANLVLVVLGYVGIVMGLSLLRKIERQTRYGEAAAEAAQQSAQAALAQAQALVRAERPWILMSVRPSQAVENGFAVMATNRGRGPARILSTVDEVVSAIDEAHLSAAPVYKNDPVAPEDPIVLLPGETTEILSFNRADVKRICETEERLSRVEKWEEKIFLYGKVVYRDLAAPDDAPEHESSWFCWYIHGRQKSGMIMAGSPAYNQHT